MVDVEIIPPQPLDIFFNNNFALQTYTHSQLCINSKHTYIYSLAIEKINDYL
jgi:hypothetical protein